MLRGKLDVYVEGALEIQDSSISGKGGLYCTLTVGTQVYSSPPITEGGTRPYFCENFEFQTDRTTELLMVQIYSENTLTYDGLLGYCTILLKIAFYNSCVVPVKPYALVRPSGLPGGHIRLSLTLKAQPRPTPSQPSSRRSISTAAPSPYKQVKPPPGGLSRKPRPLPPQCRQQVYACRRSSIAQSEYGTRDFGIMEYGYGSSPSLFPTTNQVMKAKEGISTVLRGNLTTQATEEGDASVSSQAAASPSREHAPPSGCARPRPPNMHMLKQPVKLPAPPPPNDNVLQSIEEAASQNISEVEHESYEVEAHDEYGESNDFGQLAAVPLWRVGTRAPMRGRAGRVGRAGRAGRVGMRVDDEHLRPLGPVGMPAGGGGGVAQLEGELVGSVVGSLQNCIIGAVASSSGRGDVEQYAPRFSKKVQSKDLKSGRLIGKGPSGIVYETTWEGNRYARKDFLRVPSDVFEEEAAALVGLDPHPNVVRTYCWAVNERSCSLVLELMDDDLLNVMQNRKDSQRKKRSGFASQPSHVIKDVRTFIEDGKKARASTSVAMPPVYPFDMPEALQVMLQIAEGMKFLHDNEVVHGDLKPKNILVTMSGRAASSSVHGNMTFKVADFGLVETKMKSRSLVSRQARKMEMVRWRAPELLSEDKSSTDLDWDSKSGDEMICIDVQKISFEDMARADVYNFGLTCSQILHGEDPCSSLGVNDLVKKIIRPDLPPTCHVKLLALIKSCLSEKIQRPTFQDILSELKYLASTRTDSLKTGPPSFGRIDSKLVSEHSEILQTFSEITVGHEQLMKDFRELEQRLSKRKAFSCLGMVVSVTPEARSGLRRKSDMSNEMKKNADLSTPTKCSPWLKRRTKSDAWRPKLKVPRRFSQHDIERMTNNFTDENFLGEERFFELYKGMQGGTGARVLVKRPTLKVPETSRGAIQNEIEVLSRLHHNNVVGLVGFCFEEAEQVLVYDCAQTLKDWLHGSKSDPPLNWDVRLKIALDAAKGLAYLHDHAEPPIIHKDVKPFNIFLDEKLNAKIALSTVAGTPGYIDPVCRQTRFWSRKSDVYSFGVVLVELLTGILPYSHGSRIHEEVRETFKHGRVNMARIRELLDPALFSTREEDLKMFVTTACLCSKANPSERPSMHVVVYQLEALVAQHQTQKMHPNSYSSTSALSVDWSQVGSYTR